MSKYTTPFLLVALIGFSGTVSYGDDAPTYANEKALASDMATLLRSARAVISKKPDTYQQPGTCDKGLTAAKVLTETRANFLNATGREVERSNPYLRAEMDAIAEVMNQDRALINEKVKEFKDFLPAVFAKSVADKTTENLYGKAVLKLTAPKRYVRNRANRPDKWERDALEVLSCLNDGRGQQFLCGNGGCKRHIGLPVHSARVLQGVLPRMPRATQR